MTKDKALHRWFNDFMTSYPVSNVPEDAIFPYLTYEYATGGWEDEVNITVNIWYYTEQEAIPNAKAQDLSDLIGLGGVQIPCDGGSIWIKRGSPFCQNVVDNTDFRIKRRYINLQVEFLTVN